MAQPTSSQAAGTGSYPNQNIYYNPQTDPTGGYGALSNYDFSAYAGNQEAIKELGAAYGINFSPEQLNLYAKNPQSLGSLRAGGTSSYQQGSQQGYGSSGPYGGMTTTGGIPLGTLMMMRAQQQTQAAPPAPGAKTPIGAAPGYFGGSVSGGGWGGGAAPTGAANAWGGAQQAVNTGAAAAGGGGSTMTWNDVGKRFQLPQSILDYWSQQGWTPDQIYQSYTTTGGAPSGSPPPAAPPPGPAANSGQVVQFTGDQLLKNGDQTLYRVDPVTGTTQSIVNGQVTKTINNADFPDWQKTIQSAISTGVAQPGPVPQAETRALAQMGQIDPATEALRQQVAQSYLTSATPNAAQFQNLLGIYGQVDPTSAAARQKLGGDLAAQEALGTQLDPATQREVQQATRLAQAARGNVYGTPQLVQEAMTTGQAGLALQQQRQQALQSYLQSGQTTGDVAMNMYNQQQAQMQRSLGYLTSGATPYQAGAGYLNTAENRAGAAAAGGPQFAPAGPSPYYTGAGASTFPQYGLDTSQTSANWYNLMNAYNPPAAQGGGQSKGASAGMGALKGAASGALTGMAGGPWGALIGAGVGAVGGAASGYFG